MEDAPTSDAIWLYMTAGSPEEATAIARALVRERLVACVNVLGSIQSVFWWEGDAQEETETAFVAKTRKPLVDTVSRRVAELHTYECPCIIALPIVGGHRPYLSWLAEETAT